MADSDVYSPIAQAGFTAPALYDKYRPSYPNHAVRHLLFSLGVTSGDVGINILELGAGTGKLTEELAAWSPESRIIALEPHSKMRDFLAQKRLRNVTVIDGLAQCIPLPDQSVDCVLVAQAFHWFANVESLGEIHRVLKPNGGLGLIWNMEDYNSPRSLQVQTEWEEQLREVIWALDDGQPRFKSETWQSAFDDAAAEQLFRLPLNIKTWSQVQTVDKAALENRILSYCMLQNATPDEREWYKCRIRCILQKAIEESQEDGTCSCGLQMRVSTIVAWIHKDHSSVSSGEEA